MHDLRTMVRTITWTVTGLFCALAAGQFFALGTLQAAQTEALTPIPGTEDALDALRMQHATVLYITVGMCGLCLVIALLCTWTLARRARNTMITRLTQAAVQEQEMSMERGRIDEVYADLRRLGALTPHEGIQNQTSVMQWLDTNFDVFHRTTVEQLLDGERATALMLLSLDHLDALYNREHGRQVVEALLAEIGKQLTQWVRKNDLVARWQDASFLLVMTNITLKDALLRAEDFRAAMVGNPIRIAGTDYTNTLSCGLSMMLTSDSSWRQAAERAKKALSRRHEHGPNTLYHEIL